ncbi:sigma-54 interaction domain-containing protein [Priestia megaterium]|uniref:Sigma 54-interacting transcriptional regulator n=1 Tax=Priestia megaterium TaxID=1404 RepID=A0ABD4X288_PRIMG|nr:sigma 54-interacting transcriptional regulator [Priestia megaterium]MDD9786573.1 sigma 54-interacting transcriptional regulator [Priestia megaterium]
MKEGLYMTCTTNLSATEVEQYLNLIPISALIYNRRHKLRNLNNVAQQAFKKNPKFLSPEKMDIFLDEVFRDGIPKTQIVEIEQSQYYYYFVPVIDDKNAVLEVIVYFDTNIPIQKNYEIYKEESEDLKALFESSYDVLYVSDNKGNTLRVSSACKYIWGETAENLVGRNVIELEKQGVYTPSITRLVLEKGEKISAIQTTKNNRRLLVIGTPIKDSNGNIIRVANASRDITEVELLQEEIEQMKSVVEDYQLEIAQLQHAINDEHRIIYQGQTMDPYLDLAKRVAKVDATLLILGESGVGKDAFANYIHQISSRREKPLVKINCGAIPESLLEYELFGYEKGAFPGATEGKIGLFEFANNGTVLFEEIAEIPYNLQVKLLRVLQEYEINRIGSTKPIPINVRMIASTNQNLLEAVKEGKFREDLYYRLNVIPITLPPLRERKEDILPLANFFISQFNKKYRTNNYLSPQVATALESYSWPGNIRELKNLIERLIVISEKDEILHELLNLLPNPEGKSDNMVQVHEIIPLKECVELAEKNLLQLASLKYKSTTEIAKVLKVNQSTISRKISKLNIQ